MLYLVKCCGDVHKVMDCTNDSAAIDAVLIMAAKDDLTTDDYDLMRVALNEEISEFEDSIELPDPIEDPDAAA